jgi:hypothetical protein
MPQTGMYYASGPEANTWIMLCTNPAEQGGTKITVDIISRISYKTGIYDA